MAKKKQSPTRLPILETQAAKQVISITLSTLEQWEQDGVPCHYVRFHQPIPRHLNDEPISEFQITDNKKYGVKSIVYTDHGIIWRNKDELNISALANVMYVRSTH